MASKSDKEIAYWHGLGFTPEQMARYVDKTPDEIKGILAGWAQQAAQEEARRQAEEVQRQQRQAILDRVGGKRPFPPAELLDDQETRGLFRVADDLRDWMFATFIEEGGFLWNEEHTHLLNAHIGVLWTNVVNKRGGQQIVGQAEKPLPKGGWGGARSEYQMIEWFGSVPDFIITLDASACTYRDNASFCAVCEHELLHCGQARDEYGGLKYKRDGSPSLFLRPHDAEEFVTVTKRYGPGASAGGVYELVEAGSREPSIARASIASACGTCLR